MQELGRLLDCKIREESDSGPFHMLGKYACVSTRGFESRLLRHLIKRDEK